MKKIFLSIAAMSMILATGCQNEELVQQTSADEYSLTLDMNTGSRTLHNDAGECVWGDNEQLYVVGDGGKVYGTLTMKSKSADGKKAVFSGKVVGDPAKLRFMVYPVPETDGTIPMGKIDGTNHNAPMTGQINADGVVTGVDYAGGLIKVPVTGISDMVVNAEDKNGKVVTGGVYTFNPATGELTFDPNGGTPIYINNIEGTDGFVYVPVETDAQEGQEKEEVTVEVTIGAGNDKQTQSFETEVQEGAITANGVPSFEVDEESGKINASVDSPEKLISAVVNGGSVKLDNSINLIEALSIAADKTLDLDLGGYTLTFDVDGAAIDVLGTLNIKNGHIYNSKQIEGETSGKNHSIQIGEGGILNLTNVNVGSEESTGNAIRNNGGTVEITGGTFAAGNRLERIAYAYVFYQTAGEMTINNATVNSNPNGMISCNKGTVEVNGGSYSIGTNKNWNTFFMAFTSVDGNPSTSPGKEGVIYLNSGEFIYNAGNSPISGNVIINYEECNCNWVTKVTTAADLAGAVKNGVGNIALVNDITLAEKMDVTKNLVINLNGKTISHAGGTIFKINDADVAINGEGKVESKQDANLIIVGGSKGKLTINDGHYVGTIANMTGGKIEINGGYFEAYQDGKNYHNDFCCLNRSEMSDPDGDIIVVKGGTFKNWNPAYHHSEGTVGSYVASGYKVTVWNVTKQCGDYEYNGKKVSEQPYDGNDWTDHIEYTVELAK